MSLVSHTIHRANYQGDVGLHVAKCLWGYPTALKQWGDVPKTDDGRVALLQSAYQLGSAAYESNVNHKSQIEEINTKIYHNDPDIMPLWDETRSWSLAYYRQFEAMLGIHFETWYLESQTAKSGEGLVREHVGDVFEDDDGAIIFRGQKNKLHTRVFITSRRNPTYEAKDIGLMALKLNDYEDSDRFIITTANEQSDYWQVVKHVSQLLFGQFKTKQIEHIGYGMINLSTGKMASRTGEIVTAFSLVDMVTKVMRQRLSADRHGQAANLDRIAQKVGLGAIKYSLLKTTAQKNITFDIEKSVAKEGDSGPYLMYVYVRCMSLLKKAGNSPSSWESNDISNDERAILRWLGRYNETVHQAVTQRSPHIIAGYLFELAQRFNLFYTNQSILQADGSTRDLRLKLTQTVAEIIKSGLDLLGIEVVEQL